MRTNSVVIYHGPSVLDGSPIVVIASGLIASSNSKTGNMIQTYILRADMAPTDAVATGADASICGTCPHRGEMFSANYVAREGVKPAGRTCYVNVGQGPLSVWRAWQRGNVPDVATAQGFPTTGYVEDVARYWADAVALTGYGRVVRLGTYGDPAAVPSYVWRALVKRAVAHTGYTHQWRRASTLRDLCMASADTEDEARAAQRAGWRTFRVALPSHAERIENEAICPASAEAGRKLTCADCRACGGAGTGRRGSIVIQAHGGFAVMANIRRRDAA